MLKDAWIRGILGNGDDEDMAGLTHGGKRIYAWSALPIKSKINLKKKVNKKEIKKKLYSRLRLH